MKITLCIGFLIAVAAIEGVAGLPEQSKKLEVESKSHDVNENPLDIQIRKLACMDLGGKCISTEKDCPDGFLNETKSGRPYCSKQNRCCYPESIMQNLKMSDVVRYLLQSNTFRKVGSPGIYHDHIELRDDDDKCDCDYHKGGCRISQAAPQNNACHCSYKGGWTCGGSVVSCKDSQSQWCITPGRDYNSCQQGDGDCGGYHCDCDYHSGGCLITEAAPAYNACRCHYKGAWSCNGAIVGCKDITDPVCIKPDKTLASCIEGGGDCGAY